MKFEYYNDTENSYFMAIPENDEETHGLRAQGPYVDIKLVNNILSVKYISKNKLHPDIIGAICITAFYPFIKYSATFPFPVSKTFAEGLQMDILPQHDKINGVYKAIKPIYVTNVDNELSPYVEGKETVIAYGGGADSTSLALLFPDFTLIHSANMNSDNETKIVMKKFIEDTLKNKYHIIDSNCKELCSPGGFTTFSNIFITPLMLSADLSIKNICCGEIMGTSCLSNGLKYHPQFDPKRRNRWIRFYKHIGVNIFSPVAGCSELITSKIICKNNLENTVLFCEANKGYPCYKCTKCLRKMLEFKYNNSDYIHSNFLGFNETYISTFLLKRPLYFGHIFIETIKNIDSLPAYIKDCISDVINVKTDYCNKIYSKSFIYFPEEIRERIINRLKEYADIMSEEEEKCVENWDMTLDIN